MSVLVRIIGFVVLCAALAACSAPEGTVGAGRLEDGVIGGFGRPGALALDGHGVLYVADEQAGHVVCIMADGERVHLDGGLMIPSGMVTDRRGTVYVTDPLAGKVVCFERDGGRSVVASGLDSPSGLVMDRDGDLIVACRGDGTVRRISLR